ncbi:MAG: DUF2225 domain-containing protein [Dehalococcoidia bacterium]
MTAEVAADSRAEREQPHAAWFFTGQITCPLCETTFRQVKIRDAALQPQSRESDFHITYNGLDPSLYVIMVCPHCSFAAFHDEFDDLSDGERRALREAADREEHSDLTGERSLDDASAALKLALGCNELRGTNDRHRAGLFHRIAWIERQRGDAEAERHWLVEARDAYERAYEQDDTVTDAEAFRLSYLVGDLHLRLGDVEAGSQWLSNCVSMPGVEDQALMMRMARDRLADAREAVRGNASPAA